MIPSLWIAKTGLDAQQMNMNVISNNLANVSTNGFKKSHAIFEDLMYQTMRQPGFLSSNDMNTPIGFQLGTGVRPIATERIHTQGNLSKTNSSKDVAINGPGFFQVQLPDGSMAYTRDGSFQIDRNGQMITNSGFALHPSVIIPLNAKKIDIGRNGDISVTLQGDGRSTPVGQINLANFMNYAGLENIGENLYKETNASGVPVDSLPGVNGVGSIYQEFVETSNVNVAEELVNMIQTQRAYEINSKAISSADQMLQKLSQL
ncbi:MAG: flagellar basal-body rod protein FlgG [Buchnera aphidicola (Eriosoma harunire)]